MNYRNEVEIESYPGIAKANILGNAPKAPQVPVYDHASNLSQIAAQARAFAESLLNELRQYPKGETSANPSRSGLDGKLIDTADEINATFTALQELRAYLLG